MTTTLAVLALALAANSPARANEPYRAASESTNAQAPLIGELVHFMQCINGKAEFAECPAALERDAYTLQVLYLDEHDYAWPEGLRDELRLSAFVRARCPPGHMR